VAPGQAAVFYQGDRVLGGAWIARTALAAAGQKELNRRERRENADDAEVA
jgi:hypothetical protein